MANRDARRELLAPSFIVMATALACGGTAVTHEDGKDPTQSMHPTTAGNGSGGSGGSGVVSVNPPSTSGGVGGALVSVNPPSPTGGFGGGIVSVNPPAPCPPTVPLAGTYCGTVGNPLQTCAFSSTDCADIFAECVQHQWQLRCLDNGAAGQPAVGGQGGEGGAD